VLGDAKLESEGNADEAAGKIQNPVGGVKDTLRGINHCGEVLVARTPMLRTVVTCAENSVSNLLRTEIDGESSANSRAFNAKGFAQ